MIYSLRRKTSPDIGSHPLAIGPPFPLLSYHNSIIQVENPTGVIIVNVCAAIESGLTHQWAADKRSMNDFSQLGDNRS